MSRQSRKFRFRQSRKFRFQRGRQSAGCHSLIPECVSLHRDRVPSGPRRGCAPKGSLDGWARCKTMLIEGMAANGNKTTRSETILKAELSTLARHHLELQCRGQVESSYSGQVESSGFNLLCQNENCHSLLSGDVVRRRGRVPSRPRRACAPKGSLEGWPRCNMMRRRGNGV